MLTNCTVPLKIIIPDAKDQSGPNPCFCMSNPKPIPSTMNVTMIGNDVLNAEDISRFVIFSFIYPLIWGIFGNPMGIFPIKNTNITHKYNCLCIFYGEYPIIVWGISPHR